VPARICSDIRPPTQFHLQTGQYIGAARYVDAPICRDANLNNDGDCTDSAGDQRLYYLTDANMNVTALADTSGAVVERYAYDPYGDVTVLDADGSVQSFSHFH